MRRVKSFTFLLLILLPFLGIGQPVDPGGDADGEVAPTQVSVFRNPAIVIDGGEGQISETWVNPDHARFQDDAYAFLTTTTKNKRTNYLLAQNFGFNIPAGSSILGIIVQVDRYATAVGGTVADSRVRLIDATGTIGSHDESSLVPWLPIDLDNYQTYGGITNNWGFTEWTSAQINNPNFGVALMAETSNDNTTFNLFVDEIRVTVVYLTGGNIRYAVASGNWSSPSSWSLTPGGAPGAAPPGLVHDVFIGGGHTIINDQSSTCHSLTIGTSETNPVGNLAFAANNDDLTVHVGGFVITSDGDVLGTQTPILDCTGDLTLNRVLTNRNFVLRMGAEGTGRSIISGTGSLGNLVVPIFVIHTGNITITESLLGNNFRLINGSTAHLTYTGRSNNTATLLLDLSEPGNTVEYAHTTADATDFDIHKLSITYYKLIISGNAPKLYNGPVTVFEDLTITSTGILSNQQQTSLTLEGNWTNNNGAAGFVPNDCNACTVVFQGTNPQTITNAAGEQFHRMEVNKTLSILSASNNIIIDNQLLMTSGDFDVGANSLTGTANTVFNDGGLLIGTLGATVPALTGTYTLNDGGITFNGAGNQTIRSSTSTPAITNYRTVRFLGSGTKSLSGAITVSTNLVIGGTATLDATASNFAIALAGDWSNGSTFLAQGGTVTLNGAATQQITSVAGENFGNLTINNSASSSAVVLNDPVMVNGLLTLMDGHVISSDTSLLTLDVGATVASASDGSHVNGPVAKIVNSSSAFAFPIGTGSNYMPASITPASATSTTFEAQYFSLEQSIGNTELDVDHVSGQDYWTIERTSGTADAAVTLVWEYATAEDAEIDNLGELVVAQWDGSNWASRGNAGTTGTFVAGSVQSNTVTSFIPQYFVIGSSTINNPLSNFRFFVALNANWNAPDVWAYRQGGPPTAPEPTVNKYVVIQAGNTATILDSPSGESTKSIKALTVVGTLVFGNSAGQDITVNVGTAGFTLGPNGNIIGDDVGDEIMMDGSISLNNTAAISHTVLETRFATQGNTITGNGGSLPILNVNQANQTFTGNTSFTTLTIGNTAVNNDTVTITGSLSGGGTLTNSTSGTIIWQGASVSGNVIDATAPGNTVRLVNNTGGDLDIDDFVSGSTFGHLILGGTDNFIQGADVDVSGDLTIEPGTVFNVTSGNNDLNISGNWTDNGTFNATTGTVAFTGTTTISGTSASNFNDVLISGTVTPTSVFNVRGDFTNNGSFAADTGTVVFNGTATQNISGTSVTTFNNISVTNSSDPVEVQTNQSMTGVLTLSANSVFDADGSSNNRIFTLLSTADDTTTDASIAALPSGASVTGQVTVQRYMSVEGTNGRIYRYISSPVQNAPVSQIQAYIPVTGIFAGASSCSGCGTSQSMFSYDESVITDINGSGTANSNDGYLNFPSATNSETFSPGRGYAIFVRGNVAPIAGYDSVVWSLRGPINSGNVNLPVSFTSSGTVANDGWNLVGNPYPSTIDWDAGGWTRTNLNNTTYMLDNGIPSPVYATYVAGGVGTNGGTRFIATGQAFFVKSDGGAPVLQAGESVKVAGTQTTFFRTKAIDDIMRITLRQGNKADETVIQFKSDATTDFDSNSDAHKLDNPTPMYSLATITSGLRYVINALPTPTSTTEVPLDIAFVTAGNYSLAFTALETFVNPLMTIVLRDDFLGTSANIRENPYYAFQITSDPRTFGNQRFTIVFDVPEVITGTEPMDVPHVAIYPNPTTTRVSVEVKSNKEVNAKVVSMTGTLLLEQNLEDRGGLVKKGSFNLEELADGMYILIIQDGTQLFQNRIFKKR